MNKSYAKQLQLPYTYHAGILKFSDGVQYTIKETLSLVNESAETIRSIHEVKKIFDGDIVDPPERDEWNLKISDTILYRERTPLELKDNAALDYMGEQYKIKPLRTKKKKDETWREKDITEEDIIQHELKFLPF